MAGKELEPSEKVRLGADAKERPYYASIKFQGPYTPQRIAAADLDGDGAYDFVIKQPSQGIDPAGKPNTSGLTYKLEAYRSDGTFLWCKDLGLGIEPGIWYSPFVVFDFDGDGKGVCLVDAKTGEMIWSLGKRTSHVGDGMVADIDPSVPGLECFATEDSKGGSSARYLLSAAGKPLGTGADVPGCRNWVFWDGDLLRETITGGGFGRGRSRGASIVKYKGPVLTSGIEGSIMMIADLLGDWREEVVTALPGELRIYTTTVPAQDRRVTLVQDPVYRAEVAHRSMGYEQSPVTGYYLGVGP